MGGDDKALVEVDGVAMAVRVARALREAGASSVACIGGDRHRLGSLGLDVVDDGWPGEGPLGGLATALGWTDEPTLVLAGCDQPWLDARAIAELVAAHPAGGAGAATVYGVDGSPQPLPGVYDVELRPRLCAALAAGERALVVALRLAQTTAVEAVDVVTRGALRDVDRPMDLRPP